MTTVLEDTTTWIQVTLSIHRDHLEPIETALLSVGAQSVTLSDQQSPSLTDEFGTVDASKHLAGSILEPLPGEVALWPHVHIQALFINEHFSEAIVDVLQTHLSPWLLNPIEFHPLPDKHWSTEWQRYFKPFLIHDKLWITTPSLIDPAQQSQRWQDNIIDLIINPGLAFGTGTHETTQLCLKWLIQADLKDKVVIDFGCGSGILAIAALLMGAKQVYAIDIDQQALVATQQNVIENQIDTTKLVTLTPETLPDITPKADLLIANILLVPLKELKQTFLNLTKTDAAFAFSGIISNQCGELKEHYLPNIDLKQQVSLNGWCLLACDKDRRD